MKQKDLSNLTDQELLTEAKKIKSTPIIDATLIGVMIGIVIYSVAKNSLGFFTLIPLFFVYILMKKSKKNKVIQELIKERNLKKGDEI